MLKFLVFAASVVPVFVFVKSVLFRRSPTLRAAGSEFDKNVGYLARGIVAVAIVAVLYFIARHWWTP